MRAVGSDVRMGPRERRVLRTISATVAAILAVFAAPAVRAQAAAAHAQDAGTGANLDAGMASRASRFAGFHIPEPPAGQPIPPGEPRPVSTRGRLVTRSGRVAVHGAADVGSDVIETTARIADRVSGILEGEYLFPPAAPDGDRGGGPELDVYLVPQDWPCEVAVDALEGWSLWDRAATFVRIRTDLRGLALERAVAEGIVGAVLLGVDARLAPAWRLAMSASIGARARGLAPDEEAMDRFRHAPGRPLIAQRDDVSARGAAMFVDYLVARHDERDLRFLRGLTWMTVGRTPDDAPRLIDDPDIFDVLERILRDEPGGIDRMLAEFSLARALAGTQGDTMHLSAPGRGLDATVEPEAIATMDHLPNWVTPVHRLEKTGTAYVRIDTRASRGRALNLWFHGVPLRRWAVIAVRLDVSGREMGRAPNVAVIRGEWSAVMESLDGVREVLVVIVDLGDHDLDPDVPPDVPGFFALNLSAS